MKRVLGGIVALAATLALAALSRAPQHAYGDEVGLLRLSWSGQPERIETCRTVPEEELENLPRHMRQAVVCEGRAAEYHLTVVQNGETLADGAVWGGGVRHDRPIYLYREFPFSPGAHRLIVRFTLRDASAEDTEPGESHTRLDALPRTLDLDTTLTVGAREVVLVTYDAERGALVLRTPE